MKGCIAVDLDGTLAEYRGWMGAEHIGAPIPLMVSRVKEWERNGIPVKILTARVYTGKRDHAECREAIERWCKEHLGFVPPITHEKDPSMIQIWDDRAVQVIPNTGLRADGGDSVA